MLPPIFPKWDAPVPGDYFSDFDAKFFWNWSDFQSYIDCMLVFTIVTSLLMYLFIDYIVFVEIVGFLAVFTEAMLGTPQLIKNHRNKSTEGMRFVDSCLIFFIYIYTAFCTSFTTSKKYLQRL